MEMATTVKKIDWGPLCEPVHTDIPDVGKPWRDNAFVGFWDVKRQVYGTLHVSTSPNAEGRRARFSLQFGTKTVEVIEALAPGSFSGKSIQFDGGASFTINAPRVSAEITTAPVRALGDWTGERAPLSFSLEKEQPLMHYQRTAAVTGVITLDGDTVEIDGDGIRDRTWGFRDESLSMAEYFGFIWIFEDLTVTAFKGLGEDGRTEVLGYFLAEDARPLRSVSLTRDASGLFAASRLEVADGTALEVRATGRQAGFWCPMGWERTGPTLSAYNEFCNLRRPDGHEGFGLIEQGILRRLY
ncbi:MAG: hypothetical protein ACYDHH_20995, partial [Solirubrobacteraceae bacterium]